MAPHCFDNTGPQLAAELVDHAGDSRPTCVIGVRGNSLVDLAGGEHLPWPAGQQEKNGNAESSKVCLVKEII